MGQAIHSLAELEAEAARFVEALVPRKDGATLVTLSGELGAGKTAFTKAVAKALGVEDVVNSPTFVLEKMYPLAPQLGSPTSKLKSGGFKRLVHIDAYRLENGSDLGPLGFDELMQDPGNLILLEWPEKVADALPAPAASISLEALPDFHAISYAR